MTIQNLLNLLEENISLIRLTQLIINPKMKNTSLLFLALFAIIGFSKAQLFNYGQSESFGLRGISGDALGNTYVFGQAGTGDAVLKKYNSNHTLLWSWADGAGGTYGTDFKSVKVASNGDIYVSGYTGNTAVLAGTPITTTGTTDPILLKFNNQGQLQWWEQFSGGSSSFEHLQEMKIDGNGDVTAFGNYTNSLTVSGNNYTSSGLHPIWVKYSGSGVYIASGHMPSQAAGNGSHIDIAGNMYSGGYNAGFFLSKNNPSGGLAFNTSIPSGINIFAISTDNQGNVIATGRFQGSFVFNGVTYNANSIYDDIVVLKLDAAGTILWIKVFGGTGVDTGDKIIANSNGDIFVLGSFEGIANFDQLAMSSAGSSDICIVKLDALGNVLYATGGGSGSFQTPTGLFLDPISNEVSIAIASASGTLTFGSYAVYTGYCLWLKMLDNACKMQGTAFRDLNGDGIQTVGEPGFANRAFVANPSGLLGFSGNSGLYEIYSNIGSYTIAPVSTPLYYNLLPPTSHSASFASLGQADYSNDFAFQPIPNMNDLKVRLTARTHGARLGRTEGYHIDYENVGTTTINNAAVSFKFPSGASFAFAAPFATGVYPGNDSVVWNVGTLTPGQTGFIFVAVSIPTNFALGTMLDLNARITPLAGDQAPQDNLSEIQHEVVGSFDPNEKRVFPTGDIAPSFVANGEYLEYTVYFQNTGNDTAYFVRLLDTISNNLDLSTFEFLSSSHANIWSIDHNRQLKVDYNQIMLPDSFVDEVASHGYFKYRLKPLSTLQLGSEIENRANIYFDFNAPIVTNTTVTTVNLPISVLDAENLGTEILLFPNPAKDVLRLKVAQNSEEMEMKVLVLDLQGRILIQSLPFLNEIDLSISELSQGFYFCQILEHSGKTIASLRFVKE